MLLKKVGAVVLGAFGVSLAANLGCDLYNKCANKIQDGAEKRKAKRAKAAEKRNSESKPA